MRISALFQVIRPGTIAAVVLASALWTVPSDGASVVLPPVQYSHELISAAPFDPSLGGCGVEQACTIQEGFGAGTDSIIPSCTGPGPCQPLQGVSITLSGFPSPSIRDSGSTKIAGWVDSRGSIQYEFEVVAPSGPATAPVNVVATGSSTATGDATSGVEFDLGPFNQDFMVSQQISVCGIADASLCPGMPLGSATLSFNKTLELNTNTPYTVLISIPENFTCFGGLAGLPACGLTGSFDDTIDPVITIDKGFLAGHPDVSLVLSPGVGDQPIAPGVPEPGTWVAMLAGFALLGTLLRQRAPKRLTG